MPVTSLSAADKRAIDAIWSRWRQLTRFHHSMRIAAVRELDVWTSLRAHTDYASLEIVARPTGTRSVYTVSLQDHLDTLRATETLNGLVLVESWSLAEALGRIALRMDELPQVEQWAPRAVAANYQGIGRVHGGLAGLVESYTVRNGVAHGLPTWTTRMVNRVTHVGGTTHRRGERLDLSDDALERYRSSIRSLMRLMGLRGSR